MRRHNIVDQSEVGCCAAPEAPFGAKAGENLSSPYPSSHAGSLVSPLNLGIGGHCSRHGWVRVAGMNRPVPNRIASSLASIRINFF